MIETFDDILEELADMFGVYGAEIRNSWIIKLQKRIELAISIERLLSVDGEVEKDLKYIVSVLEMQYVTSFEDENCEGVIEEYASLDIPTEEYEAIRNKIYSLIKKIEPANRLL